MWHSHFLRATCTRTLPRVTTRNRAHDVLSLVLTAATWVSVCLACALGAIALFGIDRTFFGREILVVSSGSMSPVISAGDIVVVRTGHRSAFAGDVITFRGPAGPLVTHRVVAVGAGPDGDPVYSTKGDANEDTDPTPVPLRNVIGTVDTVVPSGHVLTAMANPAVAVPLFLAVLLAESALIVRPHRAGGTNDPQSEEVSPDGSRQKETSTP